MIHVISLGAGVQSSTMALMAACGEIEPMPQCAIFADTQDEPASVYEWLTWLEKQLPFPVVRVSIGKLSMAATSVRTSGNTGKGYLKPQLPVFFSGGAGLAGRQCTMDFKIVPIQRYTKLIRGGARVSQWLGISTDEAHRMKPSREDWCDNRYPLIERDMTRLHCLEWMERKGYPRPPRSSCVFCPYHSNAEWRRLRDDEPEAFSEAIRFEQRYQEAAAQTTYKATPFLHRSCVPLAQVDFTDRADNDLFGEECEGMCGV